MKILFLTYLFTIGFSALSQEDALNVLTYEGFIKVVLENHPRVYQADIKVENGKATLLKSRGGFDPKLHGDMNQKYFKGQQYYSTFQGGLKVPTWFGITAQAGYENNSGAYLNAENRLPDDGLWYAGLQIELGNGLLIDERRAELKKAKVFVKASELEKKVILNELVYEASIAYWNWQMTYKNLTVFEQTEENARIRLESVVNAFKFGDKAAIDTLEASIQWQNRLLNVNKGLLNFQNAKEYLSLFLWSDGVVPLEIENSFPQNELNQLEKEAIKSLIVQDSVILNHPLVQLGDMKIQQSEIELKLKKEQLKPNLSLKYNAISEPVGNNPLSSYSPSNYTWGGSLSYAILTRKQRGNVKLAQLKLKDGQYTQAQKTAEVNVKIKVTLNKLRMGLDQLDILRKTVRDYQQLYQAEIGLFQLGESSLFMVNSREKSFLDYQVKLAENEAYLMSLFHELNFQLMNQF